MSLSSTSSSKSGWARLRRDVLRVLVLLVLLELIARVDPVRTLLAQTLDPYENLMWYTDLMPSYQNELVNGPHHNVWLIGSSYMMTSLSPTQIQNRVQNAGVEGITFQNYGMTGMRSFADMAEVYDHWMLQMDQPDYVIIGVASNNFLNNATDPTIARVSPMENMLIFDDTVDDYTANFLYNTSAIFHYGVLARNALNTPSAQAALKPRPVGGFTKVTYNAEACDPSAITPPDHVPAVEFINLGLARLDKLINVIRARNIPVAVVHVPVMICGIRRSFTGFDSYRANYLDLVQAHVEAQGIPFYELDTQFYGSVPMNEQYLYYENTTHPNHTGAVMFSNWASGFISRWLKNAAPH